MPVDSKNIRIAGTGTVWIAPVGTTLPTDSTTALNAAFNNVGFLTDGFEVNQEYKTKDIEVWQSLEVVRQFPTSISRKVSFEAVETNKQTAALAWGGAVITKTTGGAYSMAIPSTYVNSEYAVVLDMADGSTNQRIVLPRVTLDSLPKITAGRQDSIKYGFDLQVLQPTDNSAPVLFYGVDSNGLGA